MLRKAIAGIFVAAGWAWAAGTVTVTSANASAGAALTVSVQVSGMTDLYAFQFDVNFDPSQVSVVSITEGPFLQSAPTLFVSGAVDNVAGRISFVSDSLVGPSAGVSGSGTLVTITFLAKAPGISTISVTNLLFLDSILSGISLTATPGSVTIAGVPTVPTLSGGATVLLGALLVGAARFALGGAVRVM